MKKIILPLLISGIAVTSSATVINIPADYPTIQQGINASTDGDTVLVQPGTYYENLNFNGHNIVLGSMFLTTGDTSYIEQTAIDGNSGQTGGPLVRFSSGEDSTAVLTGFAIQNNIGINEGEAGGVFCDSSSPSIKFNLIRYNDIIMGGGGIFCINYSNPIISNNRIIQNYSSMSNLSGGIYCGAYSNPTILENIISDNWGDMGGGIGSSFHSNPRILYNKIINNGTDMFGGGIYLSSDAVVIGNEINDNMASYFGGGIYCYSQNQILICNNTIINNSAMDYINEYGGGGIACTNSNPLIESNIISGNYADRAGGGIGCRQNSNPGIINNVIFGNIADSVGGGLYSLDSYPTLINNIFWGNEPQSILGTNPTVSYCDIQGGWPGTGNIDIDPLFRNAANGDFHLMSTACGDPYDSPCIDAGSPYYSDSLLDCSRGLGVPRSDMGAYGGGDTAYVATWDVPSTLPERFVLMQNYPNPFNAQTIIRFNLPKAVEVELRVYDLLGRQIEVLIDKYMEAGSHNIEFDASALTSGVYFYRLRAGDAIEIRRMIYLK